MSLQEPIIIGLDEQVLQKDYNQYALEIGCGHHPTASYNFSLDVDRDNHPSVVADVNHIPFRDGVFQRVCLFEVLEHMSCPMLVLSEINRVMQSEGFLELSVPNIYHFEDTFLWILNKSARANKNAFSLISVSISWKSRTFIIEFFPKFG